MSHRKNTRKSAQATGRRRRTQNRPVQDRCQGRGPDRRRRPLGLQTLETRRLLVGEGELFTINEAVNTAGLVGAVSAEVRLGDGRTEPIQLTGGDQTGNLQVRFDFSRDFGNFFDQPGAQEALNFAAETFTSRFGDQLTAHGTNEFVDVIPNIFDPATGSLIDLPANPVVAANEVVIVAGARSLDGNTAALGGSGGIRFEQEAINVTAPTQEEADQMLAEIQAEIAAFQNNVLSRGQAGALAPSPTDFAFSFGSIVFDSGDRDWYFGLDPNGIQPGQTDFITIATHELAHAFGFGLAPSWNRLVNSSGQFTGPASLAAFEGTGNIPLDLDDGGLFSHWSPIVNAFQPTILDPFLAGNQRELISVLDFAGLQDIGWEILGLSANTSGEFRFADDGQNVVEVVLSDISGSELTFPVETVTVTNVDPTLTTVANQTATTGQAISIVNLGAITDPGFSTNLTTPPTSETFTFSIDWGDGVIDTGTATIDALGNFSGGLTQASFDGTHTYNSPGLRTVTVTVQDDDGGTSSSSFQINTLAIPTLNLQLASNTINEADQGEATTLTITRSGESSPSDVTIQLNSSDTSEATVPSSVVILAGQTSVTVPITAADDSLLDGTQNVTLTASSTGLAAVSIGLDVTDQESLSANLSSENILEGGASVILTVARSNTDTGSELVVQVTGGDPTQINVPTQVTIPSGASSVDVTLTTVDDTAPEPNETFTLNFAAALYSPGSTTVDVLDDEPPLFQNPSIEFDVNGVDGTTPLDALLIINSLASRGGTTNLDPTTESPNGTFFDVNGDYVISPLDALLVVNQLASEAAAALTNGEQVVASAQVASVRVADAAVARRQETNSPLQEDLVDQAIGLIF